MNQTIKLPNKSQFKMDEVSSLTGVKPYVLRFWENEFEEIDPVLASNGQKIYDQSDIEAVVFIKNMLFDQKKTIEEAKRDIKLSGFNLEASDQEDSIEEDDSLGENLDLATAQLQSMLSLVETIEQRYDWRQL